jgi:predicted nucleic acid-binding protein
LADLYRDVLGQFTRADLTDEVFLLAAQLRAASRALKTPDAIHLAAAIHHGCDEFWTNDERGLTQVASGRLAIRTLSP